MQTGIPTNPPSSTRIPQVVSTPGQWPDQLKSPTTEQVREIMDDFWRHLTRLPDYVARGEILLLHDLVDELRRRIISMMLAANGICYPAGTHNLNLYLGESQKQALEKTLTLHSEPPEDPQQARTATEQRTDRLINGYTGQAVALVVIYQWYAPQLIEKYGTQRPTAAESATLTMLKSKLDTWPLAITTE